MTSRPAQLPIPQCNGACLVEVLYVRLTGEARLSSKLIGYTRGAVTFKGAVIYQILRYTTLHDHGMWIYMLFPVCRVQEGRVCLC